MIRFFIAMLFMTFTLTLPQAFSKSAPNDKKEQAHSNKFLESLDKLIATNKIDEALLIINGGLEKEPNNLELLARKSRVTTLKGNQAKEEKDKVKFYEEAQEIASKAIDLHPSSAKGYLRRAIAKGKLILYKGTFKSRSLVLQLRSDANKVLELKNTSNYEKGLAHYLLGRANLKLSEKPKFLRLPLGLGWASAKSGAKHLKAAYELKPSSIPFTLDYALLLKDKGKNGKAKKLLESIEDLKIYDPADVEHKRTAKKALKELNK